MKQNTLWFPLLPWIQEQVKIRSVDKKITKGKILVAMPILVDPNFRQTVVLLCDHGDEGSLGLVVNRPTNMSVSKLINDFPALTESGSVFAGGPVSKDALLVLHRSNESDGGHDVLKDVYLAKDVLAFKEPSCKNTGKNIRCYLGYAGWGPGQLESEMKSGSWHLVQGDSRVIFDQDPTLLWQDMMRKLGSQWTVYASMPPDLSMN